MEVPEVELEEEEVQVQVTYRQQVQFKVMLVGQVHQV